MSAPTVDQEFTLRPEFSRRELRKCSRCGKGLIHTGIPLFWRVTIERFGLDVSSVQRAAGMELFFGGNAALADVFSDGRPIGKRIDLSRPQLVCEACGMVSTCIAAIAERDDADEAETLAEAAEQQP